MLTPDQKTIALKFIIVYFEWEDMQELIKEGSCKPAPLA